MSRGERGARPRWTPDMLYVLCSPPAQQKPRASCSRVATSPVKATKDGLRPPEADIPLVHGGCRLGDQPLLPALRAARQQGDDPHVRGAGGVSCERPDVGHRQRHGVTILYTPPTLIRSLMKFGTRPLEVMTSQAGHRVGRPVSSKAYHCNQLETCQTVVDTWWQCGDRGS